MTEPNLVSRTPAELHEQVDHLRAAPKDHGTVELVVCRPTAGQRELLAEGQLDPEVGLVGDNWAVRGSSATPDGLAHPDKQVTVMGIRIARFIAGSPARVPLAGDQLYVDLDLSQDNLPAGSLLLFGPDASAPTSVIEVTEPPHTGCAKFVERFGAEVMRFVNGPIGRPLRLRGLNARVVQAGSVRVGDPVTVRRPDRLG